MDSTSSMIEVGIAEIKFSFSPNILVTRGLGSCLGVAMYEPIKKIGALGHPMLPCREHSHLKNNPAKFVDSLIGFMVEEFKSKKCYTSDLEAKLFGGAHVFNFLPGDSVFNIGTRNVEAARETLAFYKIKTLGEDTGGNYGRTIFFDLATGKIRVKTMFYGEKEI